MKYLLLFLFLVSCSFHDNKYELVCKEMGTTVTIEFTSWDSKVWVVTKWGDKENAYSVIFNQSNQIESIRPLNMNLFKAAKISESMKGMVF